MNPLHFAEHNADKFFDSSKKEINQFQLKKITFLESINDKERIFHDLLAGFIALNVITLMGNESVNYMTFMMLTFFLRARIGADVVGLVYENFFDGKASVAKSIAEWSMILLFSGMYIQNMIKNKIIAPVQAVVMLVVLLVYFLHYANMF